MEEIFKQVQSDPTIQFTAEDVETWMEKIDVDLQYNYMDGKTSEILEKEKHDVLQLTEGRDNLLKSLAMYRLVDNLQEMRLGRYCRWIVEKENKQTLHGGGYLIKVSFSEKGTYLLCERMKKYKMQIKMDDTVVFQKMTAEEWVVVMANDYSQAKAEDVVLK